MPRPIIFISLILLFASLTAAANPPAPPPINGDPCGPKVQDNPNYPNTCALTPVLVNSPDVYGINCTSLPGYGKYRISSSNCEASIYSTCRKMEDSRTLAGRWIWTVLAPNCALGFFLPPYDGSASRPSWQRCMNIFVAMNNTAATTTFPTHFASINLKTLPGFDPSLFDGGEKGPPKPGYRYEGAAINVGYPSYALSYSSEGY